MISSKGFFILNNGSIRVTCGTGSFGHTFVPMTLDRYNPRRMVIFSRDEIKQWEMAKLYGVDERVRFFIGDVRDKDRLARALDGIDYVVHAAATKIVPTVEYNPFECVKTKVLGAPHTYEDPEHFKILPAIHNWSIDPARINGGQMVAAEFTYCSDNDAAWMSTEILKACIDHDRTKIGNI